MKKALDLGAGSAAGDEGQGAAGNSGARLLVDLLIGFPSDGESDPAPDRSVDLHTWVENWWNRTQNPLYAWEAISRSLNSGEEIPNWALEYLRNAADNVRLLAMGRDFRCADAERIDADQCVKLVGEALGLWREATKNAFARRADDTVAAHTALAEDFAGREFAHRELEQKQHRKYQPDRVGRILSTGKKLNKPTA